MESLIIRVVASGKFPIIDSKSDTKLVDQNFRYFRIGKPLLVDKFGDIRIVLALNQRHLGGWAEGQQCFRFVNFSQVSGSRSLRGRQRNIMILVW